MASNPTERRSKARDSLLEAAAELFTMRDYNSVSTRELAERADVNLGTIQYHFGSKANLFIETIRDVLTKRREQTPLFEYERKEDTREEVALELTMFISGLLSDLCNPQGPDVCKLIFRETLGATSEEPELCEALVSSVASEFYFPLDARLLETIRFLQPNIDERSSWYIAQSIIGQCSFYLTSRAFTERLREIDFTVEPLFTEVCVHIARFSLRNLGMNEDEISAVLRRAEELKKNLK